MSDDIRDKMTQYDPNAIDGDGDGMVQDATEFERPTGTLLPEENTAESASEISVEEIEKEVLESATISEAPKPAEDVISSPEVVSNPLPALGTVNGAIGSVSADRKPSTKKKASVKNTEKGYLVSDRSLYISGVGRLWKGFNVIPKRYEDKWMSFNGVRKATTEEIDKEYGR